MSRRILNAPILIALSVAACSLPDGNTNETQEPSAPPEAAAPAKDKRPLPRTSKDPTVLSLVEAATSDLVDRLEQKGMDAGDIKVLQAEHVTWRTSAMGCPQPDRGYLMVLSPGVLIKLRAAGEIYEYHSSPVGPPFLCEPPGRIETPAPGGSSLDPT